MSGHKKSVSLYFSARKLACAILPVAAALSASSVQASSLFFDTNGASAGLGNASNTTVFNWDLTNNDWATSSAGTTPTTWADGNTAVFSQLSSNSTPTVSIKVNQAVNPLGLQFTTGESYTFAKSSFPINLGANNGAGANGGISLDGANKYTYFFDSPIYAGQQVVISSGVAGTKEVLNFGDSQNTTVNNTFTNGLDINAAIRVNFVNGADGTNGVVNGNTITVEKDSTTLTTLSGLPTQEYDINSIVYLNPSNKNTYVAPGGSGTAHPLPFATAMGSTTFVVTGSGGYLNYKGQISSPQPTASLPFNPDVTNTSASFTHPTDIVLGNGITGGGNAVTVFSNSTNNYTGATIIGSTGGAIDQFTNATLANGAGSLRLGANNALPSTTDVIFGLTGLFKVWGNLDLGGFSTSVNSIGTPFQTAPSQPASSASVALGITNSGSQLSTLTINGMYDNAGTVRHFDAPIGAAAGNLGTLFGSVQSANDNLVIVYNSPATLLLGAANTYTGGTTIGAGSIVLADSSQTFTKGSLSPAGSLSFTGAGTLDLAGNAQQQVTGLTSTGTFGTITNSTGSSTFVVNIPANVNNNFGGSFVDGGGSVTFTKTGAGTLVLSGTSNAYSGNTTVANGSLVVDGSLSSATAVTVNPNTLLGGRGTIGGSVTIQSGANLAPGELAPLAIGSLTINPGSFIRFQLAGSGSSDSVAVSNSLAFNGSGTSAVDIGGSSFSTSTPYHLFTFGSLASGGVSSLRLVPLPVGYQGTLSATGNSIDLSVASVTPAYWTGSTSGNWNVSDQNWKIAGTPSVYSPGNQVVFDDTATGTTSVSIPSAVTPGTVIFNNQAKTYTVTGPINGATSVEVTGGGQVNLSGSSSFVGVVLLANGRLNVSSDASLGDQGNPVLISTSATQGTLGVQNGFSSSREYSLRGVANFAVGNVASDTATISGVVDGFVGSIISAGPGTLVLSNSGNSYLGSTTVTGGTLSATVTGALPATTDVTVSAPATLSIGASQTVGSVSSAGSILLASNAVLTSGGDNLSTSISGPVTGSGTLVKNGTGTLTLSSTANNFNSGGQPIAINAGTVAISDDRNLGNASNNLAVGTATVAINSASSNFTSGRSISLTGNSTISFNSVNNVGTLAPMITLNGPITGSGSLTISGPGISPPVAGSSAVGILNLANSGNSFSGGLTVNNAVIAAATGASLGSGGITLNAAVINVPATTDSTNSSITLGSGGGTFNVPAGGAFSLNNVVIGGQNTGLTKLGAGSLILNSAPSTYQGAWNVNEGTLVVNATDNSLGDVGSTYQSALGTGGTTGGTVQLNSVKISGGTLQLNVPVGRVYSSAFSPQIHLVSGTLLGSGQVSYGYDVNNSVSGTGGSDDGSGGLLVYRGTIANPTVVTLATTSASDSLSIQNAVMQYDPTLTKNITGVAYSTINVSGPGKVVLQGGNVVNGIVTNNGCSSTYSGNWNVASGTLQVGPVVADTNPLATNVYPFAEPLNALGFVNGDPDQPNPVKVSGGILAIAVDSPNTNPGWTANTPANPTPNYLRNTVELAGGAVASSGLETTYTATGAEGVQNGPPVTAQIGGNFQVDTSATPSKVLTADPSNLNQAMSIVLTGGVRNLVNGDVINGVAVTSITYSTNWIGALEVTPGAGGASGGSFNIARSGGSIYVTNGASIQVDAGSILNVSGTLDSLAGPVDATTPGTNFVNIFNNSATSGAGFNLLANAGTHQIGSLSGTGRTVVASGSVLSATSIRQDSLTLNGSAVIRPQALPRNSAAAVSTLNNLTLAALSTLDLNSSDLIVRGSANGASTLAAVISGFNLSNGGYWNGIGIISTSAAQDTTRLTTLGTLQATSSMTFDGQSVSAGDTLIKYTYYGDADLNGVVNGNDYTMIDFAFTHTNTLSGWQNGDFNYDGKIDGSDYTLIDNAFNRQGTSLAGAPATMVATASSELAPSPVPEPTAFGTLVLGSVGFLSRRRRK